MLASTEGLLAGINEVDRDERCAMASNPQILNEVQDVLAEDEDVSVRYTLARNSNITAYTHERLLSDPEITVRLAATRNPLTSTEDLAKAMGNGWRWASAVAANPALPDDLAFRIINEHGASLRVTLAENPNLSREILTLLTYDDDSLVRRHLGVRQDVTWDMEASAQFLAQHQAQTFTDLTRGVDQETLKAFLPNWQGSLATLITVVELTQR